MLLFIEVGTGTTEDESTMATVPPGENSISCVALHRGLTIHDGLDEAAAERLVFLMDLDKSGTISEAEVRLRFQIIGNARTENVGTYQSCMVSK